MSQVRMQTPYDRHRETQDCQVCENVWNCITKEEGLDMNTGSFCHWFPCFPHWRALEHGNAVNSYGPANNEAADDICDFTEGGNGKDATIHE